MCFSGFGGRAIAKTPKKHGFDDPLHGFAMFLGSQGLENEVEMVPETRKERREDRKKQRSSKERKVPKAENEARDAPK